MSTETEHKMTHHKVPNPMFYRFGPMYNQTRAALDKFYAAYNQRLAELLKDDSYLWKS